MSPEDTLRQHSFVILGRLQSGTEDVVNLDVALAAVAAERERCAKLCGAQFWIATRARGGDAAVAAGGCAAAIRGANESISGQPPEEPLYAAESRAPG